MSVQTECRARQACSQELCWGAAWFHKVNAVQERNAMSVQTECRATRAGSQELCWGAAWLRRRQRYNTSIPFSKFFRCLISHLESLPHLWIGIQPFTYGHSCAFSTREKKWNRDISRCSKLFYIILSKYFYFASPSQAAPQHSSWEQALVALHSVCTDIALRSCTAFTLWNQAAPQQNIESELSYSAFGLHWFWIALCSVT